LPFILSPHVTNEPEKSLHEEKTTRGYITKEKRAAGGKLICRCESHSQNSHSLMTYKKTTTEELLFFQGTVAGDGVFANSNLPRKVMKDPMFFLVWVENSPRQAQFSVNRNILHIRQNTFGIFILLIRLYSLSVFSVHD
jgi:hypothetical protein